MFKIILFILLISILSCNCDNSTANATAIVVANATQASTTTVIVDSEAADSPSTISDNSLSNVDAIIAEIFTTFYPSMSLSTVANLSADPSVYIPFLANITSDNWSPYCYLAQYLFSIMGGLMDYGDNGTVVTFDGMVPLLGCLDICDFSSFTAENTLFALNASFPTLVIKYLQPDIVYTCVGLNLPTYASFDASTVLANIDQIALFDPDSFWDFSPEDSLSIAQMVSSKGIKLNQEQLEALGNNIPEYTPLDNITSLANAVPLNCIDASSVTVLIDVLVKYGTSLEETRKSYIIGIILESVNKTNLEYLLKTVTDPNIIDAIPSYMLTDLGVDYTLIPASKLPDSYVKLLAEQQLSSAGCVSSINDIDTLSKVAGGLNEDSLTCISTPAKKSTIVKIMNAVLTKDVDIDSYQRSVMLSSVLSALSTTTGSSDPATYLKNLTTSDCQSLYPLFIAANSTVLDGFVTLKDFETVLQKVADIPASKCCSYSRAALNTFATKAAAYKFRYTKLSVADLEKLGPCLYSNLPTDYLSALDPSVFVKKYSSLGNVFQPTASQIGNITALITSFANNSTLTKSVNSLFFNTLGDLSVFFPLSSFTSNLTSWPTSGGALIDRISQARDPSLSSNDLCQLGLEQTDLDTYTSLLNTFQQALIGQFFPNQKRAASSNYTCDNLKKIGKGLVGLSSTQIANINANEFGKCESSLGSITTWSSDKLVALAARAKLNYTVSKLTDKNIASLNSIMQGFNETELVALNLSSTTAFNTLGSLNKWSTAQINAFQTPVNSYIQKYLNNNLTSKFLSSAGNLLCSIPTSYLSKTYLPESSFRLSLSTFAKINIQCPNVANWYSYARTTSIFSSKKRATTPALTTSQLSKMGALAAGISIADLQTLPRSYMSSISSLAFQNMPADTVNALSSDQISGLNAAQVSALQNSPYAASFSAAIKSSLTALSKNLAVTATTKSAASMLAFNFISFIPCLILALFKYDF